jgi:hypothetical protein
VHDHAPVDASAVQGLPEAAPSTKSWTVEPTGADPAMVGVVSPVRSSVLDYPVSEPDSRSGVDTPGRA